MIGGNPASNHPRLMRTLMQVRRRGGEVIVINPVVETGLVRFNVPSDVRSLLFGTEIASLYVQPHIGGDLALLTGIAKRIVEMGAHDEAFLNEHCQGLAGSCKSRLADSLVGRNRREKWRVASEIDAIADRYAAAKNVVFSWTMGITHHAHGVQNVQAIANLALLRGMVGRPGCGLMPIRGHSNVQGIGSVGVAPKLKDAIFDRLAEPFWRRAAHDAGRDTMACIEGAAAGELKVGFCLGGNLYGSNPDATFAAKAIAQARSDRVPQHDAQHGPRPWTGRRDDHPAGLGPRRRTGADDAGIDVQLRAAERRRTAASRSHGSEIDVIASIADGIAARADRCGCIRKGWLPSIGIRCDRLGKFAARSPRSFPASRSSPRSIARSKSFKLAAAHSTRRNLLRPTAGRDFTRTNCPSLLALATMNCA